MHYTLPIIGSLCAVASARCGAVPHANVPAMHAAYQAHKAAQRGPIRRQSTTIMTYFNVITENDTLAGGNVPQENIDQQVDVLNTAFEPAGFYFSAEPAVYTENPDWRNLLQEGPNEYDMAYDLRQGGYADLNIYITTIKPTPDGGIILAYATFPDKANQRAFIVDGVVINARTLPGVADTSYNMGMTLVHEVGHWLGLLHTFHPGNGTSPDDELAGCKGDGDFIMDTPAEATAAFDCEEKRDTCKGEIEEKNPTSEPGLDPIHNFMDYTDDACLNSFTDGQVQRMQSMYSNARINYVEGDEGEEIEPAPSGAPPHGA